MLTKRASNTIENQVADILVEMSHGNDGPKYGRTGPEGCAMLDEIRKVHSIRQIGVRVGPDCKNHEGEIWDIRDIDGFGNKKLVIGPYDNKLSFYPPKKHQVSEEDRRENRERVLESESGWTSGGQWRCDLDISEMNSKGVMKAIQHVVNLFI
jgi:hypothetical protein